MVSRLTYNLISCLEFKVELIFLTQKADFTWFLLFILYAFHLPVQCQSIIATFRMIGKSTIESLKLKEVAAHVIMSRIV